MTEATNKTIRAAELALAGGDEISDVICPHGIAMDLPCDACNRGGFRFQWNGGTE